MTPLNPRERVRRATRRRTSGEAEWRNAICEAVASGISLRTVALDAGISHSRVIQIGREAEAREKGTP